MNTNVGSIQGAETTQVLEIPMNVVKAAITKIFETKNGKYSLYQDGENKLFNSYHGHIKNGLTPAILDIQLTELSSSRTTIKVKVTNTYGTSTSNSILSGFMTEYLKVLENVIAGKEYVRDKKEAGCNTILVIIALLAILAIFIFL